VNGCMSCLGVMIYRIKSELQKGDLSLLQASIAKAYKLLLDQGSCGGSDEEERGPEHPGPVHGDAPGEVYPPAAP
jgi:hypothetical protein